MDPSPADRDRPRHSVLTGVAAIAPSVISLSIPGVMFDAIDDDPDAIDDDPDAIDDDPDAFSSAIVPALPRATLPVGREVALEAGTAPSDGGDDR